MANGQNVRLPLKLRKHQFTLSRALISNYNQFHGEL